MNAVKIVNTLPETAGTDLAPELGSFAVAWLHTTGPELDQDRIIQVGGIRLERGGNRQERVWLINPGISLSRTVRLRSGLKDQDLAGKPVFDDIRNEIGIFFRSCDLVFVPGFSNQVDWFERKIYGDQPRVTLDLFTLVQYFLPEIEAYDPESLHRFTTGQPLPSRSLEAILETALELIRRIIEKLNTDPRNFYRIMPALLRLSGVPALRVMADLADHAGDFTFDRNLNLFDMKASEQQPTGIPPDADTILRSLWLAENNSAAAYATPTVESHPSTLSVGRAGEILKEVGKQVTKFKTRSLQAEYAVVVSEVLTKGLVGFIEAGTGTGKSLGYLIAVMDMISHQPGARVILSTATKNLQTQLLEREIPRLKRIYPEIKTALLKGKGNYLCLTALARAFRTWFGDSGETPDGDVMQGRAAWIYLVNLIHSLNAGDLEVIPRRIFNWFPALRRLLQETNALTHCKIGSCTPALDLYGQVKRKACEADLIITNHYKTALLDPELLQFVDYFIIDEADQFGSAVCGALSVTFASREAREFLSRLYGNRRAGYLDVLNDYLNGLKKKLSQAEKDRALELLNQTRRTVHSLTSILEGATVRFLSSFPYSVQEDLKRDKEAGREFLVVKLRDLSDGVFVANLCSELVQRFVSLSRSLRDLSEIEGLSRSHRDRCRTYCHLAEDIAGIAQAVPSPLDSRETAQSLKMIGPWNWELTRHQIEIGGFLNERFYSTGKRMVYTSAALSLQGNFDYFRKLYGARNYKIQNVIARQMDSLLDYYRQAVAYVDLTVAEYNWRDAESMQLWRESLVRSIATYGWAANGRTLVLFTSWKEMKICYDRLEPFFRRYDIQPLIQNGTSLEEIDEFRRNEYSILFGVDRFWSGVDFPGVTLSQVLIVKGPNPALSDPVIQHRILFETDFLNTDYRMIARLRLKQGFGRLLRSEDDRGGIVILDQRYLTRADFAEQLDSLPCTIQPSGDRLGIVQGILKKAGLADEYSQRGQPVETVVRSYFTELPWLEETRG